MTQIYLRQICLVAEKLAPAIDDLNAILGLKTAFIDKHVDIFGLENTLVTIGKANFIEVVAPVQENTTAGRYLDRRNGDGGYMVICQVMSPEEQDQVKQQAADNGVRVAWDTMDGKEKDKHRIMQLHPGDMRASFFEVDWDHISDATGQWPPAGWTGWEDSVTDRVGEIVGVELQGPDPMALAEHWGAVAGEPVGVKDGDPVVALANASLRFVKDDDGRGPGLGGLDIAVNDRDAVLAAAKERDAYISDDRVMICGTRINLV